MRERQREREGERESERERASERECVYWHSTSWITNIQGAKKKIPVNSN